MRWLMCFCLLIFFLHSQVHSSSSNSTSIQLCPHDQSLALLHFKSIFSFNPSASDPDYCSKSSYPKMVSWKEGTNCCSWDGVSCDRVSGHVISIDLSCSWLNGTIHPNTTLFLLPHLQSLNLAFNHFCHSPISPQFGQFMSLTYLNLSSSSFQSHIPTQISHLSKLVSLDLSLNYDRFTGDKLLRLDTLSFKKLAQNLTKLRQLNLRDVNMSWVEPGSLRNLSSSLKFINLRYCGLQGNFFDNIFHLSNLQKLDLSFNHDLIDYFPKANWSSPIGNLHSLNYLDLSECGFSGFILASLGNLTQISHLDLFFNQFSGFIPASLGNLIQITHLDLSSNQFSGFIPASLGNLTQIAHLDLSFNQFSSFIPASLGNLTQITYLDFSYNQFSGFIPASLGNLIQITHLGLSSNQFSGFIPASVGNLTQITHLELSYNQFSNFIPASLGYLTQITYLDFSSNQFSSFIPVSLGNLTQITYLSLSHNHFFGEIPSTLSNLRQLTYLDLGFNNFRGCIPTSIANLTRLGSLSLVSNQLVGPIPSQIVPNLYALYLDNNSLNGTIPSWVFTLPSLVYLHLHNNKLTGPIHEFQYYSLESVRLDSNELYGPLPKSIFQLVNLTNLVLSSNKLSGIVEMQEFSKLQNLNILHLSYNSLSLSTNNNVNFTLPNLQYLSFSSCNLSEFPNFLRTQESLRELDLSNNKIQSSTMFGKLIGENPFSICNLSSLEILNLSNNSLGGIIPPCLGNFSNSLLVLDLRMNNFHGTIPRTFAKGNSLRTINLNGNKLEGSVPSSLINCQNLQVMDLGNNQINDTFPFWFESLPELQVLVLRSNKFHGSISSSKAKHPFPKLRILDLSNNDFNGPLPERYFKNLNAMMNVNENEAKLKYLGESYYKDSVILTIKGLEMEYVKILTTLTTIDLSKNSFQGEIPNSIGKLSSIRELNFSHNNLMGHIPAVLENLRVLESLDLSSNNLIGEIPGKLTSLTFLEFLNLSQNHLVGCIPQGNQFNTFQNYSYLGNWGLCGVPLSKKCNDGETPPPPPPMMVQEEDNLGFTSGFGWKAVLMGYGCGMLFGMVMGYLMLLNRKPKWLVRMIEEEILEVVKKMNKNAHRRGQKRN